MIGTLLKEIDRRSKPLGLTDITLAKKAGLGRDAVRDIRRGHSANPSHAVLAALAKALGCTVADLTGENRHTPIRTPDSITIFEVRTFATAGPGGDGDIEIARDQAVGEFTFPAAGFRQRFGAAPDGVFIDEVRGDSQEPTLFPGQPVMVDTRDRRPSPPGMFLCWDGIGMVLKRIELVPNSQPPKVLLKSDNPRYETYERSLDEVHIYGRVIGVWARM
ncbi:S24 family peptidase [Reyranella massiliensis]|uniref:S24 family peptidase n=1 Tax=Reyranella massiliensis TaxID=445220 RepID=UPI0006ACD118|nr:S24 family peptidase [Reyranella massiliensis]